MFRELRNNGRTVSFEVDYLSDPAAVGDRASLAVEGELREVAIAELGISARVRPGGGNTGEHIREGILIAAGDSIDADPSRRTLSVLDAAPSLLGLVGVAPDPSMRGSSDGFGGSSGAHQDPRAPELGALEEEHEQRIDGTEHET